MTKYNFINYRGLSQQLTGNPRKLHTDFIPSEHAEIMKKLNSIFKTASKIINDYANRNKEISRSAQ